MEEAIFNTSWDRWERIDNLISNKSFDKLSQPERQRIYDIRDRMEFILAEMWYKRTLEQKVVKYVSENYVNIEKDSDSSLLLNYDKYDYNEELWENYWLLINKEFLDKLFKRTINAVIKNIEDKNLKLF